MEWISFLVVLTGLASMVAAGEAMHRYGGVPGRWIRRTVHVGTGLGVAAFPYIFEGALSVYVLAGLFMVINGAAILRSYLPGLHDVGRKTWGTAALPAAVVLMLPWTWQPDTFFALQTAFLILAVCDPLASFVGERAGLDGGSCSSDRSKSWTGTLAFFLAAVLVCALAALYLTTWPSIPGRLNGAFTVLAVPLIAAAIEYLGGEGWDNLFIPIGVGLILVVWLRYPAETETLIWAVGTGVAFALLAWWMRYLTAPASVAGGLFAAALVALGGWSWALPGFTFFFTSSVLSGVGREGASDRRFEADPSGPRSAGQVYANGGIGWLLMSVYVLYPEPAFYAGFLGAMAAAAADTWASELGPLVSARPRMIGSGRIVPAGTSGAVSWPGTAAGVLAAAFIWAAAYASGGSIGAAKEPLWGFFIVASAGLVGSTADSIAGATVQAIYEDPRTGHRTESMPETGARVSLVRGCRWMDNESVNWLGTAAGACTAAALTLVV